MLSRDQARELMPYIEERNECSAYASIRDDCIKRIESHAIEGHEACTFVVPPFKWGLPNYDPDEVFAELYRELNELGYQLVAVPQSKKLLISWFQDVQTAISNITSAAENFVEQPTKN